MPSTELPHVLHEVFEALRTGSLASAAILVKSLSRLDARSSRLDQRLKQRRRRHPRPIRSVESPCNVERNIQPDGIQEGKGSDGHAEGHYVLIDVFDRHAAVLKAPHGLIQIRREEPIDEEPRALLHDHRRLPETFREPDHVIDSVRVGCQAWDDFNQRHRIGRIKKMEADHFARASGSRSERRDGEG